MNDKYQVTRAAELETLPVFRKFIQQTCENCPGMDEGTIYDLKLAVDEACTNIITHGYAEMNPGSIILSLELKPDLIITTITDFGHSFEPSEAPMPNVQAGLEDRPTGGFGLFFIYQTMDEIDYKISEDGNHLTFIKRLSPERNV